MSNPEEKKFTDWLKEEVFKQDIVMDKGYIYTDDLMSIINEVDEPEFLSKDWIDENKKYTNIHDIGYYIPVNKLYGKIVPKKKVEEEQKYVVKIPTNENNDIPYAIVADSGDIWTDALPSKYKLTEEEIRGLTKGDVLFEHFAVKAEEF